MAIIVIIAIVSFNMFMAGRVYEEATLNSDKILRAIIVSLFGFVLIISTIIAEIVDKIVKTKLN